MAKTNQPAAATISKVQAQVQAAPRTTSAIANAANLSPATTRKCLVVLATEGLAAKDEQGSWHTVPAEGTKRAKAEATKQAPAKQAPKATKPAKQAAKKTDEAPASPLTGIAAKLQALGYSERTARQDGAVVDLLLERGTPLSEAEIRSTLAERGVQVAGWAVRRLSEGRHGDLRFDPLITVEGRGQDRRYAVIGGRS